MLQYPILEDFMAYRSEISFRDYTIVFDYEPVEDGLNLVSWTAYCGPEEVMIPCRAESEFIEKQLHKYLDYQWEEHFEK